MARATAYTVGDLKRPLYNFLDYKMAHKSSDLKLAAVTFFLLPDCSNFFMFKTFPISFICLYV